jgi:hypothetical protein
MIFLCLSCEANCTSRLLPHLRWVFPHSLWPDVIVPDLPVFFEASTEQVACGSGVRKPCNFFSPRAYPFQAAVRLRQ